MFAVVTPTDEESVHSGVPKLLVGETFPRESVRKYLTRKIGPVAIYVVKFVSRSTELA
jgi:hypothetical protein